MSQYRVNVTTPYGRRGQVIEREELDESMQEHLNKGYLTLIEGRDEAQPEQQAEATPSPKEGGKATATKTAKAETDAT